MFCAIFFCFVSLMRAYFKLCAYFHLRFQRRSVFSRFVSALFWGFGFDLLVSFGVSYFSRFPVSSLLILRIGVGVLFCDSASFW